MDSMGVSGSAAHGDNLGDPLAGGRLQKLSDGIFLLVRQYVSGSVT